MAGRRVQKLLFALLLALLVVVMIEALSFAVYRLAVGSFFGYGKDAMARARLLTGDASDMTPGAAAAADAAPSSGDAGEPAWRIGTMANEVLHPFIGYVQQPSGKASSLEVGPWGFLERSPKPPPAANAYRIGIVGGSVAFLFSFKGEQRLVEQLAGADSVAGRPVEVTSLALGGMKQPQQLMTVAWLLSAGERYDMIVNIDGFNEVAFGAENARRGVYPAFPRNWSLRVGPIEGLAALESLGRASALSRMRREIAAAFDGGIAARTVTGNLIWRLLDRAVADRIAEAEENVAASVSKGLGFQETGPPFVAADDEQLYRAVAGHWARASIALDRLCRGHGIRYIHLLQPNQYVPDSKPMGAEERALAFDPEHIRREAVLAGYPQLLAEAESLRRAGVDFHDLTQMLAKVRKPAYSDTCCHLNQFGNELMAERLAEALRGD